MVPGRGLPSSQIQQLSQDQFAAFCRSGRLQRRLPAAPWREYSHFSAAYSQAHFLLPLVSRFYGAQVAYASDLCEAPLALFKGRQLSTIQKKMETSYAGYKNFHR
jgi:hypothetical protein